MRGRTVQRWWVVPLLAVAGVGAARTNGPSVAQAVQNRDRAELQALLKQGADVNAPTVDGTTALHWAVRWADVDAATLLIRAGANVNAANRYGATPLWMAASTGSTDLLDMLLKAGADPNRAALEGESPLMAAARAGSAGSVKALLAQGAAVNAQDAWRGQTALMMAAGDHEPHTDVVRLLLEHGADVSLRSKGGLTALLFAVRQNHLESAALLLNAGANANDKTSGEVTALRVAINNSHYDMALQLLDRGADPNAADSAGFTPLHVAVQKRAGVNRERGYGRRADTGDGVMRLVKSLLAHGANPNAKLPLKRLPPNFNPDGYPQINNVQYGGATPFWISAVLADLEMMRALVGAGADSRAVSMEKTTPLMVAAGLGYTTRGPTARFGGRREDTQPAVLAALKQLVEWGNDVNAVNDNGQTALHGAVFSAGSNLVQFLVERGARLDQKDKLGRTPFDCAAEHLTDKYRSNQGLDPADIQSTYAVLRTLTGQ